MFVFLVVFVILARFPDYNLSNLADERVDGRQRFSALPQVAVAVVASQEEELEGSDPLNDRHAEVPSFNLCLCIADHAHHLMR